MKKYWVEMMETGMNKHWKFVMQGYYFGVVYVIFNLSIPKIQTPAIDYV